MIPGSGNHMVDTQENYSNCCNAFMSAWHEDTLICPECGEHCGVLDTCECGKEVSTGELNRNGGVCDHCAQFGEIK